MECIACLYEYPAPDIIDGTAYFICSNCGDVQQVKNYRGYTKAEMIAKIDEAFSGVVLGDGVGLFEAQTLDDYEPIAEQKKQRARDEKINWKSIPVDVLQSCHSSLSFFDSDGLRFHLPAYIIASIKGEAHHPILSLTNINAHTISRLRLLNSVQNLAIMEYLTWCLTENEYEFYYPEIRKALNEYWEKLPI